MECIWILDSPRRQAQHKRTTAAAHYGKSPQAHRIFFMEILGVGGMIL